MPWLRVKIGVYPRIRCAFSIEARAFRALFFITHGPTALIGSSSSVSE
jgi:hypothetical protein